MNILVLGSTGFAGKSVVDCLSQSRSLTVIGASRSSNVDLRDEKTVIALLEKHQPSFIVNCAAHVGSLNYVTEKAADVISDNTKMILALYASLAQLESSATVINPIANCAFPGEAILYKESEWQNGPIHNSVLSYGNSRRLLWAFSECYRMQFGIKSINFFVPNMYGPNDSTDPNKAHALNALISKFTKAKALGQKEIPVWGSGNVIREWLYAGDFARLILKVINDSSLQDRLQQKPVNIAQNWGLSIADLAHLINKEFRNQFEIKFDLTKPDGAPKKVMSDELFRTLFADFEFTQFEVGIRNTIGYYESRLPY